MARLPFRFTTGLRDIPASLLFGLLSVISITTVSAQDTATVLSEFTGTLVQPRDGDSEILRRFEVSLLSQSGTHFFSVADDRRKGCPWPDSFGLTGPAEPGDKVQPHVVYHYEDSVYLLWIPPLITALPENISEGSSWEQNGWQMQALETRTVDGSEAWLVEARERRGRRQTLSVEKTTGVTLRADAEVFMGQGERFRMTIARTKVTTLSDEMSLQLRELQSQLTALQMTLKRRADAHDAELSLRQTEDVLSGIEQLTRLSTGTPLENLVRFIRSDTEQQKKRLAVAASRATQLMNSEAPSFLLNLMNGKTLSSDTLRGKTVVLHFWDYRDSPLSEPYGQIGYLEFLFNQKRAGNVEVVGISTNPDLYSSEFQARGRRSARKLSEFMNLTYPIGHDDGSLLNAFGDPRDAKGQLPLWVVLSPDGKVAHYHAGFYEIDAAQGLKELESVLNMVRSGN